MPDETLGELRGQRDALGDEIRALHIQFERGAAKMSESAAEAAAAEMAKKEREWKKINAKVRDLETG